MAVIIYSSSGDIRTIEKSAFTENAEIKIPTILETPLYEGYLDEVNQLLTDTHQRFYDFSNEMAEVDNMKFSLLETPEEAVVDFNILYARVQSYLSRCSSILISIQKERSEWISLKSKAQRIYKRVQNYIFINDGVCKTLKNQQLQQAYAEEKMPSLVRILWLIEAVIDDLEMLEGIVDLKLKDLDRANTNLNRQQKIVEDLIGLNYPVGFLRKTFR